MNIDRTRTTHTGRTDCGLVPGPRAVAKVKMRALAAGTELVRNAL